MLFEQADAIDNLPPAERSAAEHHLREIKVVLIRSLISDQLAYVNIAKEWFTIPDLRRIYLHRIGSGKIGGKAAGMLLARRILENVARCRAQHSRRAARIVLPWSDVIYVFMAMNDLMHWNDQKYKIRSTRSAPNTHIVRISDRANFRPSFMELQGLLERVGQKPLIVRSSSQLEDNFGTSFAGKYESFFCPNQGTPEENLRSDPRHRASTPAS